MVFASIYDLWQLGGMPNDTWRTFETDLRAFVSLPEFTTSWPQLNCYHNPKFVGLVDWLISENTRAARLNRQPGEKHKA
jgi:hypothetical protein